MNHIAPIKPQNNPVDLDQGMNAGSFIQRLLRLKAILSITEDQEVAEMFGMSKAAFSDRKRRGAFPEKELWALAAQRPELGLDVEQILHGDLLATDSRLAIINATRRATHAIVRVVRKGRVRQYRVGTARFQQLLGLVSRINGLPGQPSRYHASGFFSTKTIGITVRPRVCAARGHA